MIKVKNNNGFTVVELLIVALISSVILSIIYAINMGAINLFMNVKRDSDNLQTKEPAVEILSRYFQRWGVAVVTDPTLNDNEQKTKLPKTDKYINIPSGNAIASDPIIFYANLDGFGFVQNVSGTNANLVSCRLLDTTISSTNNCFYVFRNGTMLPAVINTGNDSYLPSYTGASNIPSYDSVSFASVSLSGSSPKECTDEGFRSQAGTNPPINMVLPKNGTVIDNDTTNISSVTLQPGDLVYKAPYRVEIFVKSNSDDDNKSWLYVKLTNVASACNTTKAPQELPIAPADSVTATNSSLGLNLVQLTINLRSESKDRKGQTKNLVVTRIFGS